MSGEIGIQENLKKASKRVCANGVSPGMDRMTVDELARRVNKLQPIMQVLIPSLAELPGCLGSCLLEMELIEIMQIITEKVIEIISEDMQVEHDEIQIKEDDSLIESGLVDSLNVLQLIESSEMQFDIIINSQELTVEHWDSIEKISRFIQYKLDRKEK